MTKDTTGKMPTQRQLRVGEEIRHALSEIFLREGFYSPTGKEIMLTISEVRVSPDLRNATVYSMTLAGEDKENILPYVQELEPRIRHLLSKKVRMKYLPQLSFKEDVSFERAHKIDVLLHNSKTPTDEDNQ